MTPDQLRKLAPAMNSYMNGDGNTASMLQSLDNGTLLAMQRLLGEVYEGTIDEGKNRSVVIGNIVSALDGFEAGGGLAYSAVTSLFHDLGGEDERGNAQADVQVRSAHNDAYERRTHGEGILPRTKSHWVTPYAMLKNSSIPQDPDNVAKVHKFVLGLLKDPHAIIDINGHRQAASSLFTYGRKQGSSQTRLYMDPRAQEYIISSLGLVSALPAERSHWLAPSGIVHRLGLHTEKTDVARQVMGELISEFPDRLIDVREGEATVKKPLMELANWYRNTGPAGLNTYAAPELVDAMAGELKERIMRRFSRDHYLSSVYELAVAMSINTKTENYDALSGALRAIRARDPDRQVELPGDHIDKAETLPMSEVIRDVTQSGRELVQIDKRAIPVLAGEIRQEFERQRFPNQNWIAPLEAKQQLGGKVNGLTNRNVREAMREVMAVHGEDEIQAGDRTIRVREAFYVFGGPKGDAMKVMPEALDALAPLMQEAIESLRSKPRRVGG